MSNHGNERAISNLDSTAELYRRLKIDKAPNTIRVLDLKPSRRFDGALKATLRTVSLSENPHYEALSYTWGDCDRGNTIQVNRTVKLPITDNLFIALRRLRTSYKRTLWVDAICINQDDLHERSSQVAIMGQVYKMATIVLVWLGEYENACRADAWQMRLHHKRQIGRRSNSRDSKLVAALDRLRERLPRSATSVRPQDYYASSFAAAMGDALLRANPCWIERAWTVQEFVLARNPVFIVGPHSIDSDAFVQLSWEPLSWPRTMHWEYARKDDVHAHLTWFQGYIKSLQLLSFYTEQQTLTLFQVHTLTAHTQCRDPHDKIYSLQSLIGAKEARIQPNYDETPSQTFAKAAFASITTENNFDILALVRFHASAKDDLPSWVPDFSLKLVREYQYWINTTYTPARRLVGQFDSPAQMSQDTKLLTARGLVVGRVASSIRLRHQYYNWGRMWLAYTNPYELLWSQLLAQLKTALEIEDVRTESSKKIWPLDDFNPNSVPMPALPVNEGSLSIIATIFEAWADITGSEAQQNQAYVPFWVTGDVTKRSSKHLKDVDKGLRHIKLACENVYVFVTTSGHIGIAGQKPRQEDQVVLLSGAKLPMLIRPGRGASTFHGLAFVFHLSELRFDGLPVEEFVLR